jgi:hypothetical protein
MIMAVRKESRVIQRFLALSMAFAMVVGAAQASEAATRVRVAADKMRMVNTANGEAAKAEGHVTIEVVGEVRIHAPVAQLVKGKDGKLDRAVFPGSVRIEDLRKDKKGTWKSEHNNGGYYDFRNGSFTEINPKVVFEFEPRPAGGAAAKPQ